MKLFAIKQAERFAKQPNELRLVACLEAIRDHALHTRASGRGVKQATSAFFEAIKPHMKKGTFGALLNSANGCLMPFMPRGCMPRIRKARILGVC